MTLKIGRSIRTPVTQSAEAMKRAGMGYLKAAASELFDRLIGGTRPTAPATYMVTLGRNS